MVDYRFVLLDLDGTLTDSRLGIVRSIYYALDKFGLRAMGDLSHFIGPPLHESFCRYYSLNKEEAGKAVEYYREYYARHGIYENSLYAGIPELLRDLQNADKAVILATSKPTFYAQKILHHFNLENRFAMIIGSSMDGRGTDKARIVGRVLARLAPSSRDSAVMVGDRMYDIAGARAHGIDSIAVTYGYGTLQELRRAGATYLAHSVDELKKILV